jgi:sugar/nucleoside kinase (ribokinase family)
MSNLLIVGTVAFDDLQLPSGTFENVWGGSASFATLSASYFTECDLVAVIGSDFPEANIQALESRGVHTEGIERAQGKSFRWGGKYSDNLSSRQTVNTELNVFGTFSPKVPEKFRHATTIFLGNIHPALQAEVLNQCEASSKKKAFVCADTMNFWIDSARDKLIELLPRVDILIINDEEVRELGEVGNIAQAAKKVLAMGPRNLVVKLGEHGALLFSKQSADVFFAPAMLLDHVVDPTGAGDTFAGGMVGYIASTGKTDPSSLRRAIGVGCVMASFNVQGVGPSLLLEIKPDDVRARLEIFRKMTAIDWIEPRLR